MLIALFVLVGIVGLTIVGILGALWFYFMVNTLDRIVMWLESRCTVKIKTHWWRSGLWCSCWLLLYCTGCTSPEQSPPYGPKANCVEVRDLLKNRPYPPKHGVHSYAKEVPRCGA